MGRLAPADGFTVAELLVATAITFTVTLALLEVVDRARASFESQPERSDMHQRLRVAVAQHLLALRPSQRIVLMSGFSGTWTPASVRTLGLVDMLVKPLSAAALADGVSRAIAASRPPS